MFLKTLDGLEQEPIEPTPLWYPEPCAIGPMWKLCLLIVPLNPLPLEVPETSTLSPAAKMSALISLPISKLAQFSNLNSFKILFGSTPAFL